MFNAEEFMNAATDPMATQMQVCPEGEWLFIIDTDPAQLQPKNVKGISSRTGKPYDFWQIELNCHCQSEEPKAKLGRDKLMVRMRLNLDLDPSGRPMTGPDKNVQLGRLREALGQNTPGWSPKSLLGAGPFIGKVEHQTGEKGTFANIERVSRVS